MSTAQKASSAPALAYEKMYVPAFFTPLANALLDRIAPSGNDRILDVACGTGIVGRLIRERVGAPKRLAGIDINPAMIEVARELAPQVEYECGDATELAFGAADFDVVLCQHGLMFFPDRAKALRQMRRVVAGGGRIGVSTWRSLAENPVSEAFTNAGRRHVDGPLDLPFSMGDEKQLAAMLEAAGFVDVRVETVAFEARFPDAATFLKMNVMAVGAVLPQFATMTDGERAAFTSAIESDAAAVVTRYRDGDGLRFPVSANLATATAAR